MQAAADAIITVGETGTILSVNRAAEQTFDYAEGGRQSPERVAIIFPLSRLRKYAGRPSPIRIRK
jgi:hypothetical protein